MKLSNILFVLFIGLIFSCAESEPKEAELFNEKMKQTIAIHDEVMPKMTKITMLIQTLDKRLDSTNVESLQPAILDLKLSHDKMMTWMKNFGDDFSRTEINEGIPLKDVDSIISRLKVLDESQRSAEDMRNFLLQSIENAETLIEKS
jgi:hypothetical protein